jgi:hypothetical protein
MPLDQNYLVGGAVGGLSMSDDSARGSTLWQTVVALVPLNFGHLGVVTGFFALGLLVAFVETTGMAELLDDNWERFALSFTVGISFLQVGGSFVEMVGTACAASSFFPRVLNQWKSPRVTVPGQALPADDFSLGPDLC